MLKNNLIIFKRIRYPEIKKINWKLLIFRLSLAIFLFAAFLVLDLVFIPPSKKKFPSNKIIPIESGFTLDQVKSQLKENKIIKSSFTFELTMRFLQGDKSIKAGNYLFDKPYSGFEIAKKIIEGDFGIEYSKILIKEGDEIESIALQFEKEGLIKKEDLYKYTGCCAGEIIANKKLDYFKFESLEINPFQNMLEGYFFPDTYFFPKNTNTEEIIKVVLNNFNEKIKNDEQLKLNIKKTGRGFYEILIMASILEKEAIHYEDKRMIADILWRRIQKKMPLQVDASLQYITGRNTFDLTKTDLMVKSPYNTYRYPGLPITPIANPGINSIRAAADPSPNKFWYYLSDKYNILYYSETYEQHLEYADRYLR